MKALVLEEYNRLVYKDVPEPEIGPKDVLIQVKACGICGSDVHGMDGSTGRRIPPIIMGHEASGVIAGVGTEVSDSWKVGERVTFDSTVYTLDDWFSRKGLYNLSDNRAVLGVSCGDYRRHGAFAEYVAVPEHILYKLPEQVTFNQAAMVEPIAVAIHAVELTPVALDDTAIVVGAGMIGLFLVQVLKAAGCGRIIAVDLEQERLDLAHEFGADVILKSDACNVVEEVFKVTENRGADIAFEVVGITPTVTIGVESLRKGGTLTLVGNFSPTVELPLQTVVTRQLRLQGSCAICGEYPAALDMIERGVVNVEAMFSAAAPLSEGAAWFKRLYDREKGLMKVLLFPE
jgi:L-iditol 2-dehydrogenase